MSNTLKKISSISLSVTTAIWLSGAAMILPVSAVTTADLQAQIAALLVQIQALQAQLSATQGLTTVSYNFTRDLTVGSKGDDVKALQQFLNSKGYKVATTGAGSAGNETTTFGSLTKAALGKYQAAVGISPTAGYFGAKTRAYVASVAVAPTTTTTTTTTTGPAVPTGEGLAIALSADTPGTKTIGSGTAFNSALKVSLTAGSKDVKITGITLQKSGFIANTNLNGVDIVDSQGVRHGQVVTSVNADNTITILMTSDPVIVKAGLSETLTVRFNLLAGNYTGTVNFNIASAAGLTTDTASVTGTFPLAGAIMNAVDGSSALASTTLQLLTSTGSSTLNVDPASLQEITKFRISEASSKEGLYLYKWTLYNYGNAAATDYKDVTLVAQDGTVLATSQPSGQYVIFDLSATPYFIDKGLVKDLTIKAKIVGGTTKTIKLVTYNDYDLDIRGATTGVSIIPGVSGTIDTSFPLGSQGNLTTIGSGTITLQRASDSPSSAVTPGATNVVLAKFVTQPNGENYELRQVKFYIASSSGVVGLTGTIYVKVNNVIVYSVGASSISVTAQTTVNLSSYPILTAGVNNTITIEASISSSATASDNYTVTNFDLTSVKRLVSNDLLSDSDAGLNTATVSGLQISVQAAKLAVVTLVTPVADSAVVGTNNFEFAQIQLNAQTGGEDVKVTSVTVTNALNASAARADVSNLAIYKDSETSPLATTASTATNAATVAFTFSNPIIVLRTAPVTLHLKANVVANASGGTTSTQTFYVASTTDHVVSTGVSTGNSVSGGNVTYAGSGQAMIVVAAGKLILSLVSGSGASPSAAQVLSVGTTGVTVFAFKMTSQYEAQKITSLVIRATSSLANTLATTTLKNIKLYEGSATTPFATAAQFDSCNIFSTGIATSTTCKVTFTASDNLLSAAVPVAGVTIYVKADVAAGGTAILGNYFNFLIASSTGDVAVKGAVTGSTAGTRTGTPTASGISYVVSQNVVIVEVSPTTAATAGSSGAGAGAGQQLAVFKVTNSGGAAVYLTSSTVFKFAQSGTTTSTHNLYVSAQNGSTGALTQIDGNNATTSAAGYVPFNIATSTSDNRKIDGGAYRYLVIKNKEVMATGKTAQFSVGAITDLGYDVAEADLGYDANGNGTLDDTVYNLPINGIPSLATITAL